MIVSLLSSSFHGHAQQMRISPLRQRHVYRENDGDVVTSMKGGLACRRREGSDPIRSGGGSVSSVRSSDDDYDHGDDDYHRHDDDTDHRDENGDGDGGSDNIDDGAHDDDALYLIDGHVRYSDGMNDEATYQAREPTRRRKRDSHHQRSSVHPPHRTPSPHARSPPSHANQLRAARQTLPGGNHSSQFKSNSSSDGVGVKQLRERTTSRHQVHEATSDSQSDEDQEHPHGQGETNISTLQHRFWRSNGPSSVLTNPIPTRQHTAPCVLMLTKARP